MRHRYLPLTAVVLFALSLSGCSGNDNDSTLDLGSVSIGQQLIDIKKARDAGAITGKEYRTLKADLLDLMNNQTTTTGSDENDDGVKITISSDNDDDNADDENEDDESWLLF